MPKINGNPSETPKPPKFIYIYAPGADKQQLKEFVAMIAC